MTLQKVTKKSCNESKKNCECWYGVHCISYKTLGECQRHTLIFHVFAFSGQIILKYVIRKVMSIVQPVPVYGWHMQTVRGTVSITK